MKFNWGTGILIFLILFLLAAAAFIIFAINQDVNLVHKDYYEKGVDYTEQMTTTTRSAQFENEIQIELKDENLLISFEGSLVANIDSGKVLLYRPSNSKQDVLYPMNFTGNSLKLPQKDMVRGRYILKLSWYSDGLKYEIDREVNIK